MLLPYSKKIIGSIPRSNYCTFVCSSHVFVGVFVPCSPSSPLNFNYVNEHLNQTTERTWLWIIAAAQIFVTGYCKFFLSKNSVSSFSDSSIHHGNTSICSLAAAPVYFLWCQKNSLLWCLCVNIWSWVKGQSISSDPVVHFTSQSCRLSLWETTGDKKAEQRKCGDSEIKKTRKDKREYHWKY